MKILTIVIIFLIVVGLLFGAAFAAGDAVKGKALFNDTKFAGATSGMSCNSCHPDGRGLENAAAKKEFHIMGKKQNSLEEAVNACIEAAIKGKPIDKTSNEMKDIVAYIGSLGGMMEKKKSPGY